MKQKGFITLLIILALAIISPGLTSCKRFAIKQKQKRNLREIERKKKERDKEAMKKYQDAIKHHADIQTKKTRKQMKKTYRKAERHNYQKKEFFLKRWFKRKGAPKQGRSKRRG